MTGRAAASSPVPPELLAGLDGEALETALASLRRRAYRRGEQIFLEGDPGDCVHIVERGHVMVRRSTPAGDVLTLTVLGRGDSFGELALLTSEARRTASVAALDETVTAVLHRADFDDLRRRFPAVQLAVVASLTEQVRRLSDQLLAAMYAPVDDRVVDTLARVARRYDTGRPEIDIPIRQEDLASMAGTSRPTVNRILRGLEAAGVVRLRRGGTVVLDPVRLGARSAPGGGR